MLLTLNVYVSFIACATVFCFHTQYTRRSLVVRKMNKVLYNIYFIFSVVQQPYSVQGPLFIEVSTSHTIRHACQLGTLLFNEHSIAEATTYTIHNKHKRRTCLSSAWFEPTIPAIKRLQISALDRAVTGIVHCVEIWEQALRKNVVLNLVYEYSIVNVGDC